jgi:hypothetical protein
MTLFGILQAHASPITYSTDIVDGSASVVGTITTDGTIGTGLSNSIITGINVTVTDLSGITATISTSIPPPPLIHL